MRRWKNFAIAYRASPGIEARAVGLQPRGASNAAGSNRGEIFIFSLTDDVVSLIERTRKPMWSDQLLFAPLKSTKKLSSSIMTSAKDHFSLKISERNTRRHFRIVGDDVVSSNQIRIPYAAFYSRAKKVAPSRVNAAVATDVWKLSDSK